LIFAGTQRLPEMGFDYDSHIPAANKRRPIMMKAIIWPIPFLLVPISKRATRTRSLILRGAGGVVIGRCAEAAIYSGPSALRFVHKFSELRKKLLLLAPLKSKEEK